MLAIDICMEEVWAPEQDLALRNPSLLEHLCLKIYIIMLDFKVQEQTRNNSFQLRLPVQRKWADII